jgi:twinkle protein
MDVSEISQRLRDQAETIAKYLLPGGKINGREWIAGNISGMPGKSLKVCVSGAKQGIWSDFASGDSGDLIDLWMATRGIGIADAIKEIKNYLGIDDRPDFLPIPKKVYSKPARPAHVVKAKTAVVSYLEGRKIPQSVIEAFKVAEAKHYESEKGQWKGPFIVFPYLSPTGDLEMLKYLHVERKEDKNGKKQKQTVCTADCRPILWGWQALPANTRTVVITEGEIDAMSMAVYGYPALSVPFGGGSGAKQQWIDHQYDELDRFETIYLALDNDEAGKIANKEISQRLGLHRCRVVVLPFKDANECLKQGVSKEEIYICMAEAKTFDPEELRRSDSFTDEVMEEFYPTGGKIPGVDLPWKRDRYREPVRIQRGEVSIWTGGNGQGKSLMLGQFVMHAISEGERACIASLEMAPRKTLSRQVRQATCQERPARGEIKDCLEWLGEKLYLFNLVGTAQLDRLLEVFDYAVKRYGVNQLVIDSLLKCGVSEDDKDEQKAFVNRLCEFAERTGAHIHLVAHSRKQLNEDHMSRKNDVRGSAAITDLGFNVFSTWRNKPKEAASQEFEKTGIVPKGFKTSAEIFEQPDAILSVEKHRQDGDKEGRIELYLDRESMQFSLGGGPVKYYKEESKNPEDVWYENKMKENRYGKD